MIDGTLLSTLNTIGADQSKATENSRRKYIQPLDCVATSFPRALLRFHTSVMQLIVDSDEVYLVLPKAKSQISGFVCLGESPLEGLSHDDQ